MLSKQMVLKQILNGLLVFSLILILVGCESTKHEVNFDFGGGQKETIYVEDGELVTAPELITKVGYEFGGWFYNNLPFDFDEPIKEDKDIIGQWIPLEYNLSVKDFMNKIIFEDEVSYGSDIHSLIPVLPKMFGYAFDKWTNIPVTMPANNVVVEPEFKLITDYAQSFDFGAEIVKMDTNYYSNGVLLSDGRLIMWGRNEVPGMLCGPYDGSYDTLVPKDVTAGFDLEINEQIIDFRLGISHNYAITSEQRIFHWGGCNHGNLSFIEQPEKRPVDVSSEFEIEGEVLEDLYFIEDYFLTVTISNKIFTKGHINYGQFGEDALNMDEWIDHTSKFPFDDEVVSKVVVGRQHSGMLTSKNKLFMFGKNSEGQLGIEKSLGITEPFDIVPSLNLESGEFVTDFDLGSSHSLVLTNLGRVFGFGWNAYGQLGIEELTNTINPVDISDDIPLNVGEKIISVIAFDTHNSLFFTDEGRLIGLGYNKDQMLLESEELHIFDAVVISDRFNLEGKAILDIIIGEGFILLRHDNGVTVLGNKTFDLEVVG